MASNIHELCLKYDLIFLHFMTYASSQVVTEYEYSSLHRKTGYFIILNGTEEGFCYLISVVCTRLV